MTSLYRYFHFDVAARCRRLYGSSDGLKPLAYKPPTALAQNHKRDFQARQILLVFDALVARHQHIESCILGGCE